MSGSGESGWVFFPPISSPGGFSFGWSNLRGLPVLCTCKIYSGDLYYLPWWLCSSSPLYSLLLLVSCLESLTHNLLTHYKNPPVYSIPPGLASAHKLSTALVILAPEPSQPGDLVPHFLYSFNNKQGFLIQSLQTPYPFISMFARRNIVFTCPQTLPDPRRGNGPLPAHFTFAPCK